MNISMYPIHRVALEALARRDGHSNLARVVQELIARRSAEVYGDDWATILTEDRMAAEAVEALAS